MWSKLAVWSFAISGIAAPAIAKEAAPPQPVEPNWEAIRPQLETAVRSKLVDPDSAKITWDNGFKWGGFRPFLSKRVYGWATCGTVNSRNRMGGYTGASNFVIVYWDTVRYVEIDDQSGLLAGVCAKAALPQVPASLANNEAGTTTAYRPSIADEIGKLAALRDKGVINSSEFDEQKSKLLNQK